VHRGSLRAPATVIDSGSTGKVRSLFCLNRAVCLCQVHKVCSSCLCSGLCSSVSQAPQSLCLCVRVSRQGLCPRFSVCPHTQFRVLCSRFNVPVFRFRSPGSGLGPGPPGFRSVSVQVQGSVLCLCLCPVFPNCVPGSVPVSQCSGACVCSGSVQGSVPRCTRVQETRGSVPQVCPGLETSPVSVPVFRQCSCPVRVCAWCVCARKVSLKKSVAR
jgi:hypothetical protein